MKNTFKIAILALITTLFVTSCSMSPKVVQNWDTVSVHYTGTFENGEKFDSSYDRWMTLDFQVWAWNMISGFDKAVVGMKVWEKKSISLAPSEAYWEISEDNYKIVEKSELKAFEDAWIKLEKGQVLPTDIWNIEIVNSDETTVTLNGNHPMAGKTLKFDIEMVNIVRE